MKKLLFATAFILVFHSSYGQSAKTTGGCGQFGEILSIFSGSDTTLTLIDGESYSVSVSLFGSEYPCGGDLILKMSDSVVGTLPTVYDYGFYTIPLKRLNFPSGAYILQYWYHNEDLNEKIITIMGSTGVGQVKASTALKVYPLPAKDLLNIKLTSATKPILSLRITDMYGKEIPRTYSISNSIITIPVNDFPTGLYVLQLVTENEILTQKIMIAH